MTILSDISVDADADVVDAGSRAAEAAAAARPAIVIRDLTVRYPDGTTAVRDVTLAIAPGAHLAILGASGSGKTTLLGAIAGRVGATEGSVERAGRVASIYQDLRLVRQATALENVLHGSLARHGLVRSVVRFPAADRERAAALLQRVGLAHKLHAAVAHLSGGEQQRVAIARALMQDPAVLLADEPVAALDNANARAIMRLLHELRRERDITLVSVLHDCALAETFADRILGMEAGRIVHDCSAGEAASAPQVSMSTSSASQSSASQSSTSHAPLSLESAPAFPGPGIRGFRRFEACVALEAMNTPAAAPAPTHGVGLLAGGRRPLWYAGAAIVALAVYASAVAGLGITSRATEGAVGNILSFVVRLVPRSWAQVTSIDWLALLESLWATIQMSFVGTTLAVLVSWPLAALAARNVGPQSIRGATRFLLNGVRSVPSILWALLFVAAVGLGEFAGVLALVAYSIGYLTKFFYEGFEGVDPGPPRALAEIGASGPQQFVHAVWPAARAAVLSSVLFMLEYNVRAASVLGVVGAGGIGYDLKLHIDYGNYHVVGAILLMLAAVVLVLDAVSGRLRARLMGR